jgi:hypothetical protein
MSGSGKREQVFATRMTLQLYRGKLTGASKVRLSRARCGVRKTHAVALSRRR